MSICLKTVDDAAACLDYLLILGPSLGATYFTYDRFGTCHLWSDSARVCDGMSGPDGQLWEQCEANKTVPFSPITNKSHVLSP